MQPCEGFFMPKFFDSFILCLIHLLFVYLSKIIIMKIKDLQEGVNVHKGFNLPNYDDSHTVVWELNRNVLSNWIARMRFTGEDQCHFSRTINDQQKVVVDSIEQSRNNFINGKAAMLQSWNTNN